MGRVFQYRCIEFFVFDYGFLPCLLLLFFFVFFWSGVTFPLLALDKVHNAQHVLAKMGKICKICWSERDSSQLPSNNLLHIVLAVILSFFLFFFYIYIYMPWPFPPFWWVADNIKKTTKTMGVLPRSSSNNEGPSQVWMALLEQHSPSSPVFHNLRRFTDSISPTARTTVLPL